MIDCKEITLGPEATIRQAMELINRSSMQIVLVADREGKLLGTVTDGDIRRGLLEGLGLDSVIEKIMHISPVVASINDSREHLRNLALLKDIKQIPLLDSHGIVVGIETFANLFQSLAKSNKVVLMVGGLGTRLRPLTEEVPKPLLKVGNRPILETIVTNFAQYGFKDFIFSVNYKSQMIEEYFGDGSRFGVTIEYVQEEQRMGTAGALSLMREKLQSDFFVMNGDLLTNVNFEHLLNFHRNNQAAATMCVRQYDFQVPYGVVELEGEQIRSIVEKPVHNFFVSAGIYVLNPETLQQIPDGQFYDMPTLFDVMIAKGERCVSFPIHEYWLDIGRMSDYQQANDEYDEIFQ